MRLELMARDHATKAADAIDALALDNLNRHKIVDFVRLRSLLVHSQELGGPAFVGDDGLVTAVLYDDQIAALDADQAGSFTAANSPDTPIAVARISGSAARWDRSTSLVRFHAVHQSPLSSGTIGRVALGRKPRQVIAVPATAVMQSREGPYVLVPVGGSRFEKREIEIGETFAKQGFAVVISGLDPRDMVVARGAFFIDAEVRAAH
jgi:hypothetical protein